MTRSKGREQRRVARRHPSGRDPGLRGRRREGVGQFWTRRSRCRGGRRRRCDRTESDPEQAGQHALTLCTRGANGTRSRPRISVRLIVADCNVQSTQRCSPRYPPGVRALANALVAVAIVVTSSPASAAPPQPEPTRIEPTKLTGKERRAARRARDASEGGTENGTFEFVLGSITAVVTAVVIGRGIWELTQLDKLHRDCDNGAIDLDCGTPREGRGNQVAAGVSFGVAVPLSVAAGFLFARGARARRDYQAWHATHPSVSLAPAAGPRGGGLTLRLRF